MIVSVSGDTPYRTMFTDGKSEGFCDTTSDKGGSGSGFRPHDLLEAALASCINMNLRMFADKSKIRLDEVRVKVSLNRDDPEETVFEYEVELKGDLGPEERRMLAELGPCPVGKTMTKRISLRGSSAVFTPGDADKASDGSRF